MIADAVQYAKWCKVYQIHADFIHQSSDLFHPMVTTWSFEAWGIDVIGLISLPSMKGHWCVFAITDYFLKWVEAVPLAKVKTINAINFIKYHVIYRFGVP